MATEKKHGCKECKVENGGKKQKLSSKNTIRIVEIVKKFQFTI